MNATTADFHHRAITELDHVRILNLLRRQASAGTSLQADDLAELIDAAEQLAPQAIGADVVTMHTRLRASDAAGAARSLTLCYPQEADAAQGLISVLSPLGTALLGLRVGETAHWQAQGGTPGALKIEAIEYQPEANGDYTD